MFVKALLGKAAIVTTALLCGQIVHSAGHVYLNDSDNSAGAPAFNDHLWPRVILSETKSMAGNQDRYSKYNLIAGQAALIPQVAKLQARYPAIKYFRMFTPREVQEYENNVYCSQGKGIPFEQTTASTGNCGVYAGHWLYSGGSTTTKSINSSVTNVTVSDASRFSVGQYAVIYNAPAGSFNNAEHVKITGKNGSTLTIQRGYKSNASSHGNGSIIAQHVLGQGGNHPLNWSYNLSTACPKDASGQVISTYLANFLKNNIKKDREGDTHNIAVSGILFDVDFYFELGSKKSDVNNDLNIDHGISGSGQNMWGTGLDQFYAKVRNHFPNLPIIAGTKNSRGFGSLSGTQVEGWLGGFSATPNYRELDSMFGKYLFSLNDYSDGPLHTHVLNKQSTKLYPVHGNAPDNKPFRLGLTMALMGDGYYGQENSPQYPDPWYDEYAVDVKAGSANYGRAVSSQSGNEPAIVASQGWLGRPKGSFYRIYDDGQFAASQSLVGNGNFDSNTNGWSGNNVSISRDTGTRMDGNASLRASTMNSYQSQGWKAAINGPSIYLVNGTEYTLAYSVRASSIREISVQVGSINQNVLVGPKWKRRVMTFKAKSTGNHKLSFQVGRENTSVWIDSVYLFQGNANILRRDFDNGIAIANATPSTRTINLGGTYRRILGTQDNVNNGATVTSVTIPAYDGLVLVNQPGSTGGGTTGGGTTGGGTTGGGTTGGGTTGGGTTGGGTTGGGTTGGGTTGGGTTGGGTTGGGTTGGGTTGGSSSGPFVAGDECGKPVFNAADELSLHVWKDCSTGKWYMRAPGGGSSTGVTYSGQILSDATFTNIVDFSLESSDSRAVINNGKTLTFTFKVWKDGLDGTEFKLPSSAYACLYMNRAQMKIGPNRKSVPLPFNMKHLNTCK